MNNNIETANDVHRYPHVEMGGGWVLAVTAGSPAGAPGECH